MFGYFGTYTLDGRSALYENCARNASPTKKVRDLVAPSEDKHYEAFTTNYNVHKTNYLCQHFSFLH